LIASSAGREGAFLATGATCKECRPANPGSGRWPHDCASFPVVPRCGARTGGALHFESGGRCSARGPDREPV